MPSPRQLWGYLTRRLLARVLSAALCSVLIVIQPLSKYGGPSAFLALTIKELVFSVQATLAQQLEATVLHLAGGLLGIGLSALGKYIGSLASPNTPAARMIPALFLCGISFLGRLFSGVVLRKDTYLMLLLSWMDQESPPAINSLHANAVFRCHLDAYH